MNNEQAFQDTDQEDVLESVEQDTIPFYGKPIVAVTLADGRRGVVLRWMCEGLEIDTQAQVRRLKRSPTTKGQVWPVRVDTEGGRQSMPTLNFKAAAYWLATINPLNFEEGARRDNIVRFQLECMDVLHEHFVRKALVDRTLIPAEPLTQPASPAAGAAPELWISYHEQMAEWYRWQRDVEAYRAQTSATLAEHGASIQDLQQRVERQEELTEVLPEILAHYRHRPLSDAHQASAQAMVRRLHEVSGRTQQAIWGELNATFHVAKYERIDDSQWPEVFAWFKARILKAGGDMDDLYNQDQLF